jgi:hypothetical protein
MSNPSTSIIPERIQAAIFVAAGVGMLLLAAAVGYEKTEFLAQARRAEGLIVALEAGTSHVRVEFTDHAGNIVVFPGNGRVRHRVGERVPVVYSEAEPLASAELDEPGSVWNWTVSLACLGLAFCVVGTYILRKRRTG